MNKKMITVKTNGSCLLIYLRFLHYFEFVQVLLRIGMGRALVLMFIKEWD